MNKKPQTILVYNENCVMAGKQVSRREIDNYDGDPDDCNDWHEESLTKANAAYHANHSDCSPNKYHRTIAATIRDAMAWG